MSYSSLGAASLGYHLPAGLGSPAADAQASGVRSVRAVSALAQSALDASVTRYLCFLYDQPGCGRFAVNEDHGNNKAAQEKTAITDPLASVCDGAAQYLVDHGDPSAEVPLVGIKLKICDALEGYVNVKFASLSGRNAAGARIPGNDGIPYHNPVGRNDTRGDILRGGKSLVACLGALRAYSPSGKAAIRAAIERALASSRARQNCYARKDSGCDKSGESEPNERDKAAEENRWMTQPLADLLARPTSALGQAPEPGSSFPLWLGVGAAVFVGAALLSGPRKAPRQNRRRKRRTSRRRAT